VIQPNAPYDVLRGRNFSHPFTHSLRTPIVDWDVTPRFEFPLFKTENGYDTVITKFLTIWDFGPFGTPNFFRAGLRENGRMMAGWRDGAFRDSDPGYAPGNETLRGNGFVPCGFINGVCNQGFDFLYLAKPNTQISLVVEQWDTAQQFGQQQLVVFLSGAQLAA
jgi:hypothetical protein